MKQSTVNQRRQKRSFNEGNSSYARKIALQKRGVFRAGSPFSLTDGSGMGLQEFTRARFKKD